VIVLAGAFDDPGVVDEVTAEFTAIGAEELASGTAPGDHFAEAGANMRIWNALEKLAVRNPPAFARYYGNDMLALVCEAWLGPGYQVTSQVNQVNPGSPAQSPHRDYHLGFQSAESAAAYPAHVHGMSSVLTLQGAVAHCDMPLESGPTLLLPHSQKYRPGYVAWQLPEFVEFFAAKHVQLPLSKGDAVFFSPALHHAAGSNVSADIQRMANLLQVSSAFGRAMEAVDRERMSNAVYPVLLEMKRSGAAPSTLGTVIAATAEGYAFPTNLDRDQPHGSVAPPTQADLVHRALDEEWHPARLASALADSSARRASH
jgi:ectoine hydroxylase-related dioxygenase (phytanoyl-CoA dioxygenase family)